MLGGRREYEPKEEFQVSFWEQQTMTGECSVTQPQSN